MSTTNHNENSGELFFCQLSSVPSNTSILYFKDDEFHTETIEVLKDKVSQGEVFNIYEYAMRTYLLNNNLSSVVVVTRTHGVGIVSLTNTIDLKGCTPSSNTEFAPMNITDLSIKLSYTEAKFIYPLTVPDLDILIRQGDWSLRGMYSGVVGLTQHDIEDMPCIENHEVSDYLLKHALNGKYTTSFIYKSCTEPGAIYTAYIYDKNETMTSDCGRYRYTDTYIDLDTITLSRFCSNIVGVLTEETKDDEELHILSFTEDYDTETMAIYIIPGETPLEECIGDSDVIQYAISTDNGARIRLLWKV